MAFGENLKKRREALGITTAELAESALIAQQQISKYEAGISLPTVIVAAKMAERLGVTVEYLVNGEE